MLVLPQHHDLASFGCRVDQRKVVHAHLVVIRNLAAVWEQDVLHGDFGDWPATEYTVMASDNPRTVLKRVGIGHSAVPSGFAGHRSGRCVHWLTHV